LAVSRKYGSLIVLTNERKPKKIKNVSLKGSPDKKKG
jgi:hypothetical protein